MTCLSDLSLGAAGGPSVWAGYHVNCPCVLLGVPGESAMICAGCLRDKLRYFCVSLVIGACQICHRFYVFLVLLMRITMIITHIDVMSFRL